MPFRARQICLLTALLPALGLASLARAQETGAQDGSHEAGAQEAGAPDDTTLPPGVEEREVRQAVDEARSERAANDTEIRERLEGVFSNVEDLSGVEVDVSQGVVRLAGDTPSRTTREKAVEIAGGMDGVVYVDNQITDAAVEQRVKPAMARVKELGTAALGLLPLAGIGLVIVILFWLLARVIREWDLPFRIFHRRRLVRDVLRQITATVVFLLGVVLALELLEATALVGAVLGAAGLAGLAVGFAFRDIAENYLASILLGSRRPFAFGDHVVIGEHEGKVMRLTTRDTVLMTLEGNHLRLPNAVVYKAVILNYTRNPLRMLAFDVGASNDSDLSEAQQLGVQTLLDTRGVISDPRPFARVEELGDSNVKIRFFAWVDQGDADWYKVRSEAVRRVKVALDAAGIELPVPIYRVETVPVTKPVLEEERQAQRAVGERQLETPAHEVEVDRVLERQMEADAQKEGDGNLLDER